MSDKKRGRGQPRHYEENKEKVTIRITPTAIASLDQLAALLEISRSELVERFARLPQEDVLEMLKKNSRQQDTSGG